MAAAVAAAESEPDAWTLDGSSVDLEPMAGGRAALSPPPKLLMERAAQWRDAWLGLDMPYLSNLMEEIRGNNRLYGRHLHYLMPYPRSIVGEEVVTWLVETGRCATRMAALELGQQLVMAGLLHHVHDDHQFKDARLFYRFYSDESGCEEAVIHMMRHGLPLASGWLTQNPETSPFYFIIPPNCSDTLYRYHSDIASSPCEKLGLRTLARVLNLDAPQGFQLEFEDGSAVQLYAVDAIEQAHWVAVLRCLLRTWKEEDTESLATVPLSDPTIDAYAHNIDLLANRLREPVDMGGLPLGDHKWLGMTFRKCFKGSELHEWLQSNLHVSSDTAMSLCEQLLSARKIRHTLNLSKFSLSCFWFWVDK